MIPIQKKQAFCNALKDTNKGFCIAEVVGYNTERIYLVDKIIQSPSKEDTSYKITAALEVTEFVNGLSDTGVESIRTRFFEFVKNNKAFEFDYQISNAMLISFKC